MAAPNWLGPKGQLHEVAFCKEFLKRHPLRCIHGSFFGMDGYLEDEAVKRLIYLDIQEHVTSQLARDVDSLLRCLRLEAPDTPLPLETDRIHFLNGTYRFIQGFQEEKDFCAHRLQVRFDQDAPVPFRWLLFLEELLEQQDILVLQEYLGYCLIPSTQGQKMLTIIGSGGEGKSRIGLVLEAILGNAMNTTSIAKVETNRFARADLEHKLLMVDDDLDMNALTKTNYIKSIVTAGGKMDVERKGIQSYQTQLYVRFLCFGNGPLRSAYDHTEGFRRRQLVLKAKPKRPDRVDDPNLIRSLLAEKEGILLWMLEGLFRLMGNDFRFSKPSFVPDFSLPEEGSPTGNLEAFFASEDYIQLHPQGRISTKALYSLYRDWCQDNAESALALDPFSRALSHTAKDLGLTPITSIRLPNGRRCRGYIGVTEK